MNNFEMPKSILNATFLKTLDSNITLKFCNFSNIQNNNENSAFFYIGTDSPLKQYNFHAENLSFANSSFNKGIFLFFGQNLEINFVSLSIFALFQSIFTIFFYKKFPNFIQK